MVCLAVRIRMFCVAFSLLLASQIAWKIVLDHGTFMPPFVQLRTSAHNASIPRPIPSTFGEKRESFKVVVSLTTMPHHLDLLEPTLKSLTEQTYPADVIYLNLPKQRARSGAVYYVPEYVKNYDQVKVLRPDRDYGPLTKLMPSLEEENDPDTLIITVDDDKVYHPDTVRTLVYYSKHDKHTAWGDCGWGFQHIWHQMEVIPVYVPWIFRGAAGRQVEVLQAVCGNAYRRSMFQNLTALAQPPKPCFTTDDLWISGFLKFSKEVSHPRAIIPENIEPHSPEWKKREDASESPFALSTINTAGMKDIGCIRAVEQTFNRKWFP
eukprot:TRINITY_DN5889_c0_g3_i1.p1 TRINITY_DN5889_c0_g3~~TRINITY_DN5889_c0_g3_i1.p1  ORF type:complete len:322 (+),score=21.86 TRINITY_DN5889_c0_g3_i1:46-1011(+)